jgi:hypothetical protein
MVLWLEEGWMKIFSLLFHCVTLSPLSTIKGKKMLEM